VRNWGDFGELNTSSISKWEMVTHSCKMKPLGKIYGKGLQVMVDHFMHLFAFFAKCIIFKWHKCIIKSSI
jgi:hypothetical protein